MTKIKAKDAAKNAERIEEAAANAHVVAGELSELEPQTEPGSCSNPLESDDDLESLFSAFDDVSTPAQLKESTLQAIEAIRESDSPSTAANQPAKPRASRFRMKWRMIRVAAVAACLALALGGGAAYAVPTSHIHVSQGETEINLGVNCFGRTVSAESNDESGNKLIQAAGLLHQPFEDSLDRAFTAFQSADNAKPVEVSIEDADEPRRQSMEAESAQIAARHGEGNPGSPAAGSAPANSGDQASGQATASPTQPSQNGKQSEGEQQARGEQPGQSAHGGQPNGTGQSAQSGQPSETSQASTANQAASANLQARTSQQTPTGIAAQFQSSPSAQDAHSAPLIP